MRGGHQKRKGLRGASQAVFCFGVSVLTLAAAAEEDASVVVSRLTPPGGQAGTTVTVVAAGEFPAWPVSVWTDRGQLNWAPQEEAGKFSVAVPDEGAFGLHWVRFADGQGATAVQPFVVGNISEAAETEPNDNRGEATVIDMMPVTINGVLDEAGDVDGFRVRLEAGETLVASLLAHEGLNSPIDAVLELVDAGGAYQARNLDAVGLDPRLVHTATRDGDSVVRVYAFPSDPNSTIGLSGSADSRYRLTLTTNGFLTGSLPTAVSASTETTLQAAGANLPQGLQSVQVATSSSSSAWVQFPGVAGVVKVPVVEPALPVAVSNSTLDETLLPPFVASGQFLQADQVDRFLLEAMKDQNLQVQIESQKAGFEADPLLVIRDANGSAIMAKQERDASYDWTVPADGTYTFEVRDRRGRFGPGYLYRLTVVPQTPAVSARISADHFTTKGGGPLAIEIAVDRQFGYAEPVEFLLVAAPEGVTANPVTSSNEGESAKKVTLNITAGGAGSGPIRIGHRLAGSDATEPVVFGSQSLAEAWLTVLPATEPEGKPSDENDESP